LETVYMEGRLGIIDHTVESHLNRMGGLKKSYIRGTVISRTGNLELQRINQRKFIPEYGTLATGEPTLRNYGLEVGGKVFVKFTSDDYDELLFEYDQYVLPRQNGT